MTEEDDERGRERGREREREKIKCLKEQGNLQRQATEVRVKKKEEKDISRKIEQNRSKTSSNERDEKMYFYPVRGSMGSFGKF